MSLPPSAVATRRDGGRGRGMLPNVGFPPGPLGPAGKPLASTWDVRRARSPPRVVVALSTESRYEQVTPGSEQPERPSVLFPRATPLAWPRRLDRKAMPDLVEPATLLPMTQAKLN